MTVIEAARPSPGKHANDMPGPDQSEPASPTTGRPATPRRHRPPALLGRGKLVALAVGAFLLPWSVLLGLTLPATAEAQHWSLVWAGLDGAEALAALATAALLARADARAGLTAAAGGALLLADAWFDVCTSAPGLDHVLAVADAVCVELPLAGASFWLAVTLTRSAR